MSGTIKTKVELEVINTEKEFKWRLKKDKEYSPFTSQYDGILSHTFINGETFYVAMGYWEGVLPIEKPFKICFD
jgi:hypothetical protein